MTRTLTLKREALARLTDDDLLGVVGAGLRFTVDGYSCGIRPCEPTEPTLICRDTVTGR